MSKPFVSVLIDTYNHERFIEQAIVSVLEQDFPSSEREILVVDDGSTDGTAALVRKFAPQVRLLSKPNGGQASAFNAGIPETHGEIVAFLDGDDWWAQRKLRAVVDALESNPKAGMVGHGFFEEEAGGQPSRIQPSHPGHLLLGKLEDALLFSYWRCFFGTSRVTIRKTVLEQILPIPEALVVEADEFMSTVAATSGAVALDQALTHYRLHPGNLFHFRAADASKLLRKQQVMSCLAQELPCRLREWGVPQAAVDVVTAPIRVDAQRLELLLDGGWPWQTFRVERESYRLSYRAVGFGYRAFQAGVLGLTLMLPPRSYYRLRQWYAEKGIRKLRRVVGEPTPAAPILEQRPTAAPAGMERSR